LFSIGVKSFVFGMGNKALRNSSAGLIMWPADGARIVCKTHEVAAVRLLMKFQRRNHKAQTLMEYAMVAALVSAAVALMSTYVFRSVQAAQQTIQDEFQKE
jgi:hypothetical protein